MRLCILFRLKSLFGGLEEDFPVNDKMNSFVHVIFCRTYCNMQSILATRYIDIASMHLAFLQIILKTFAVRK